MFPLFYLSLLSIHIQYQSFLNQIQLSLFVKVLFAFMRFFLTSVMLNSTLCTLSHCGMTLWTQLCLWLCDFVLHDSDRGFRNKTANLNESKQPPGLEAKRPRDREKRSSCYFLPQHDMDE